MLGVMASLNILAAEAKPDEWYLPGKELRIELVEWDVITKCLGRKEYFVESFNCFKKSSDIFDQESCFANGKYSTIIY